MIFDVSHLFRKSDSDTTARVQYDTRKARLLFHSESGDISHIDVRDVLHVTAGFLNLQYVTPPGQSPTQALRLPVRNGRFQHVVPVADGHPRWRLKRDDRVFDSPSEAEAAYVLAAAAAPSSPCPSAAAPSWSPPSPYPVVGDDEDDVELVRERTVDERNAEGYRTAICLE